jgi:hypothetical protein
MPDREIIRRLEEELQRNVRENLPALAPRLHEYRRQYFGFTRAGNQQVFVVGFCGLTEIDWLKELVPMPSEAGCYFEGQFDVAGAHFLYLWELGGGV